MKHITDEDKEQTIKEMIASSGDSSITRADILEEYGEYYVEMVLVSNKVFELVKDLRTDVKVPFVFMTYANVVFSYGMEKFLSNCKESMVDGLILPDLPFEEKEEFLPTCQNPIQSVKGNQYVLLPSSECNWSDERFPFYLFHNNELCVYMDS